MSINRDLVVHRPFPGNDSLSMSNVSDSDLITDLFASKVREQQRIASGIQKPQRSLNILDLPDSGLGLIQSYLDPKSLENLYSVGESTAQTLFNSVGAVPVTCKMLFSCKKGFKSDQKFKLNFSRIMGEGDQIYFKSIGTTPVTYNTLWSFYNVDLKYLVERFPNITEIDLEYCTNLRDDDFEHLANLQNLTRLNLRWCYHITDSGLRAAASLQGLKSLDLGAPGPWITHIGLRALANCQGLIDLSLESISDNELSVLSIARGLQSLNLTSCKKITDAGLGELAKLEELTSLDVTGCGKITDEGFEDLANRLGLKKDGRRLYREP